jgi:hypothetical protein
MATISTNDIVVNYKLGDVSGLAQLEGKLSNLTKDEQAALAEAKRLTAQFQKMGNEGKAGAEKVSQGLSSANSGMNQMSGVVGKLGPLIAGAFSATAIINFGKAALEVTGKFQTLSAVLKNTLGSDSAAQGALVRIQELASKTPFSVEELTRSFVKLANQGFQPTNAQIVKLGDLASSTGKNFDQLAEAIIDAQVGEFERLKEFGIRAQKQGDEVKFTFKGVETTVKNTNTAIRDYIVSLGDVTGVTGAMKAQSDTLEGSISNLGDAWDLFLNAIGNNLAPIYKKSIQVTAAFLVELKNLFQSEESKLQERQGTSYNIYVKQLESASDTAIKNAQINSSKRLEIVKKETIELQKEADKTEAAYAIAMSRTQDEKGGGFAIRQKREMEAAKVALSESKKIQTDLEAMNQAAMDVEKKRSEERKKSEEQSLTNSAENLKRLKQEYEAKVKLIEIQKQYEVLLKSVEGNVPEPQAKLGAEVNYLKSLESLQREYAAKGVAIDKTEIEITKLNRQKANDDLIAEENNFQLQMKEVMDKNRNDEEEKRKASNDARIKAAKEAADAELAAEKKLQEEKQKAREEAERMAIDLAQMTVNSIFNLQSQYAANDLARKQRQFDEEIRLADGNQQKITEIEEKRRAAEKEARIKQFKADQMQAIANVIFNTAPIIAKYAAGVVTAPLATIAAASAALQIGFILAQPVPEFAKGVENFEGGPAIVGEKGRELVRTDSGSYLTPDRATLTYLPRGADVITAPKTRELLAGNSTLSRGRNEWSAIDTAPIAKAIMGMPVQSLEISERGLERYVTKGNRTTKILNKKRGANL